MAHVDPKTGKRRYATLVGNRTVGPAPPPLAMEQRLKGEKHPPELRLKARAIYVYDKRPIIEAAQECGVSNVTVRRWKTQCLAAGDDWDMARQLTSLSSSNRGLLLNALLEDFLKQYRGTIAWLDKSATNCRRWIGRTRCRGWRRRWKKSPTAMPACNRNRTSWPSPWTPCGISAPSSASASPAWPPAC